MMTNWRVTTAGAAALAMAVPASAAIYMKIPDLPGESSLANAGIESDEIDSKVAQRAQAKGKAKRKDSGEAHLDYLTITLTQSAASEPSQSGDDEADDVLPAATSASAHEATHAVQQGEAGSAAASVGPVRWMAPESTRDAASGMASGKRQHKPLTATKELDMSSPLRASAPAGSAKFSNVTLKRGTFMPPPEGHGPGRVSLSAALPGCEAGKRYPHVLLGEEGGEEVQLVGVSVAECASEQVTLNYEKVKWEY